MRILIAEDEPVSRRILEANLTRWGFEIVVATDGNEAWNLLQQPFPPPLLVLDWLMPSIDGLELCRRIRQHPDLRRLYILLVTSRTSTNDLVTGLDAGADDYVTKPFEPEELRARIRVGERVFHLQSELADRVKELESALSQVRQLRGLLPICAYCKKIRDDGNYWHQVEGYLEHHSDVQFSHGICPDCIQRLEKEIEMLPETKPVP